MIDPPPEPHLVLRTGTEDHCISLTNGNQWTIGRSDNNHLVIKDHCISRIHAILQRMDNGDFYLIDLGSRNGSFVNGRWANIPVKLRNQDQLTLGQTNVTFCSPPDNPQLTDLEVPKTLLPTALLQFRRLISVLVVDMRNFTQITRQMDEVILSELMSCWFLRAGDILGVHGSWIHKYIGDGVMAVWIHDSHGGVSQKELIKILRAINALQSMTGELWKQFPLPFPLRVGIGVNTGYAIVKNTGSNNHPDYTPLGDTVNGAFRLESSTKQIKTDVALGETTYGLIANLIHGDLSIFHHHLLRLKGYDSPILSYSCSFKSLGQYLQHFSMDA